MDKIDGYLNKIGASRTTSIGDAIAKISGKGGSRRRSTRSRRNGRAYRHRCRPGCRHRSHKQKRL